MAKRETMWKCEIGLSGSFALPPGSDFPMRQAIARAFLEITGREPDFLFSGWGDELTEAQREVVRERGSGVDRAHFAGFNKGGRS